LLTPRLPTRTPLFPYTTLFRSSQEKELKALAAKYKGADIKFTGRISDSEVQDYLMRCRAMIFSAEEDFGIIPVEAQACGRPVIRSEEHTSELQSRENLVCRLLL